MDTTDVGVIVEPRDIVDDGVAIDVLNKVVIVDEIDVVEETDVEVVEVDVVRPPVVGLDALVAVELVVMVVVLAVSESLMV